MSKKLSLSLLLVFILAMGVVAVQAADTTVIVPKPSFTDGRLNVFDTAAPVIVFETRTDVPAFDSVGLPTMTSFINGVQLLQWNNDMQNTTEVLNVSAEKINAAIAKNTEPTFNIATENGYELNYSQTGWFWVTAPADFEGKVYTFSWAKGF